MCEAQEVTFPDQNGQGSTVIGNTRHEPHSNQLKLSG
jgi:hypothetical protein